MGIVTSLRIQKNLERSCGWKVLRYGVERSKNQLSLKRTHDVTFNVCHAEKTEDSSDDNYDEVADTEPPKPTSQLSYQFFSNNNSNIISD